MIHKITDDLHQFAEANASIGKLFKLFSKFLDLCAPLVNGQPEQPTVTLSGTGPADKLDRAGSYTDVFGRAADQAMASLQNSKSNAGDSTTPRAMGGWDDSLIWELFDNQPSLGWTESDLWNAMAQF